MINAGQVRNFADQAQKIGDPRVITGLLQRLSKELPTWKCLEEHVSKEFAGFNAS